MMTVVVDVMSLHEDGKNGLLAGDVLDLTKSGGNLASMEEIAACVQLTSGMGGPRSSNQYYSSAKLLALRILLNFSHDLKFR